MSKLSLTLFFTYLLSSCSQVPYFSKLDPISMQRTVPKYGEGKHYFFRSWHRFSSKNNIEEKEQYYRDVEGHIEKKFSNETNCEIIKETLSYYSESGSVSVLVICRNT